MWWGKSLQSIILINVSLTSYNRVGHEITHGFDDQGSQKDGEGNLVDWWEPETKSRYLEKARWDLILLLIDVNLCYQMHN